MVAPKPTNDKLQKVLAHRGLGSRREIEGWIRDNRLKINGKIATLGDRVSQTDVIALDGKTLSSQKEEMLQRVIAYHKPIGQICSRKDPKGRDSVFDHLPPLKDSRWVMVGRLDYNTSGVLLFTNVGELAHRLMHPSYQIEREYAVRVFGAVDEVARTKLIEGIAIDGKIAKFSSIVDAGGEGRNHWFHVILKEGQNREIRNLFEQVNTTVSRLMRIRYANIKLERSLRSGTWAELTAKDLKVLFGRVELPAPKQPEQTNSSIQTKPSGQVRGAFKRTRRGKKR